MWKPSPAKWRECVALLATLLVAGPVGAQAHPHALVVYSIVLSLPPGGVDRIGFVFTFDPLFSAIILRNVGEGDPVDVLRNHERSLRQLPFEIEIAFNGVPVALETPTDLQVSTEGVRSLIVSPCHSAAAWCHPGRSILVSMIPACSPRLRSAPRPLCRSTRRVPSRRRAGALRPQPELLALSGVNTRGATRDGLRVVIVGDLFTALPRRF
jgi:hypothetical protein